MPGKTIRLMLSPATALLNRMTFYGKFAVLALIALLAVGISIFSLYASLNQTISSDQNELEGLALLHPAIKTVQLVQQHRVLSSGVLGDVSEYEHVRAAKEHDVEALFASMEARLPDGTKQRESWKNITAEWKHIQADYLRWTRAESFAIHTQLINEILRFVSAMTDDYGMSTDPNLDSFYLLYASSNQLLKTLEYLGQVRAHGIGILKTQQTSELEMANMNRLMILLDDSLKPLKVNLEKAAYYNPGMKPVVSTTYANVERLLEHVRNSVYANILRKNFHMPPGDFFTLMTQTIDAGYAELDQALLPAAEQLIRARMHHVKAVLYATCGMAFLLFLLMTYFMTALYYATVDNIKTVTQAVTGFVRGDLKNRVHLKTQDELSQICDGFNSMADDLTEMNAAREATLNTLTKIANRVPGLVYQYRLRADGSSCFPFASEAMRDIYRLSPDQVREDASKVCSLIHPDDLDELTASIRSSAQDLTSLHHEYRVRFADGTVNWLLACAMPEREADGSTLWHGVTTNITERKQVEAEMRIAATAFESQEGIMITDAHRMILRVNHAFTTITGYTSEEAIGKKPQLLSSGRQDASFYARMWDEVNNTGTWQGEIWDRRKNGEIYPEYLTITVVKDSNGIIVNYVATFTDSSAKKAAAEAIQSLAFYDPLTHLPNRRLLQDRLKQALVACTRSGHSGALLFLDLDHFKTLNDSFGHDCGDLLLQQVAQRLSVCVRESDTVARLGGDEFVVLLEALSEHPEEAATQTEMLGGKILAALNQPYLLAGHEIRSTPSIGITLFSGHQASMLAVVRKR